MTRSGLKILKTHLSHDQRIFLFCFWDKQMFEVHKEANTNNLSSFQNHFYMSTHLIPNGCRGEYIFTKNYITENWSATLDFFPALRP